MDLTYLVSVMGQQDLDLDMEGKSSKNSPVCKYVKHRCLTVLFLLISGNVNPNPGPDPLMNFDTPADFKLRSGIGFLHLCA